MAMAQFLFIQAELQDEDAAIGMPASAWGLLPAADREVKSGLGLGRRRAAAPGVLRAPALRPGLGGGRPAGGAGRR